MTVTLRERYRGTLLGLACGDAVGTTAEFATRGSFTQITDMCGGGPFNLQAGQWTDDTSMALCLAESLLTKRGFDARDQMGRYLNWWRWGYLSSTGACFDIGATVRRALEAYQATGEPMSGSVDPSTAGNGSLMRLAPVVLFYYPDRDAVLRYSGQSSRTTHGASEAIECCRAFAALIHEALSGTDKPGLLATTGYLSTEPRVAAIMSGAFLRKGENEIRGSGYCVDSLEAALWCFMHTDSFEAAVLRAANLGDDADTTAAIVGQIAGAFYGSNAIPRSWLDTLHMKEEIQEMADNLMVG